MTITCEITGDVARITFDDGKVNAMSPEWFDELGAVLDKAERETRVAVIAGRPGAFSAGLDIKRVPKLSADEWAVWRRRFATTMLRLFSFPLPTVAEVGGHAIAGGAVLALACDLRVGLEGAHLFQLNEVAVGLAVPNWMQLIVAAAVPPPILIPMLLHARAFTPREAFDAGIVQAIAANAEALREKVAAAVAALCPLNIEAYAKTKRRMRATDAQRVLTLPEG